MSTLVDDFVDAWNRHDAAALVAVMADDGIYEVVPQGRIIGPDKLEEQVASMHSLSSDFSIRLVSTLRDGNRFAVEWELNGTNDGSFEPFRLTASGSQFSIRGAWFFLIEEGKIKLCRAYWDFAGLLNQIGVRPPGQVAWHLGVWAEEASEGP